ncbi:MAG: carbohydrate ABC transporter permease [Spirochaetales bacterium]|nr:carbohydrate ABC transporter permease [Spirochaetales bacterium]
MSERSLNRYKTDKAAALVVKYCMLLLFSFLILFPLVLVISSSFKTEMEIFSYPVSIIPKNPVLANFQALMENFPRYIFNSFKLTLSITFIQLVTASTAGYALAKLKWKGRNAIFLLYIASIMIPFQVFIIPQFIIVRSLKLYNTHLALILVSAFTAFGTFLVRQFFMTIPDSYIESAKISGAGHFTIFIKIILPLSRPVMATLGILSFRYWWNDLFTALIYLNSKELKTLPLGLADFVSEYDVYYGPQMAASLIALLPVVLVFIVAQKYIVQGMVSSGIKG